MMEYWVNFMKAINSVARIGWWHIGVPSIKHFIHHVPYQVQSTDAIHSLCVCVCGVMWTTLPHPCRLNAGKSAVIKAPSYLLWAQLLFHWMHIALVLPLWMRVIYCAISDIPRCVYNEIVYLVHSSLFTPTSLSVRRIWINPTRWAFVVKAIKQIDYGQISTASQRMFYPEAADNGGLILTLQMDWQQPLCSDKINPTQFSIELNIKRVYISRPEISGKITALLAFSIR